MLGKALTTAAAGNAAGAGLYVEEVFSTYLYDGNGSTQTITNGVDLDGEGGLVWGKCRSTSRIHALYDTERGVKNRLRTNDTNAEDANIEGVTSFNSNGFTLGTDAQTNFNGNTFASWTFRKAPKFFDVVTYTGTGTSQTISHNLGSAPGCLIIKRTDSASNWFVYHRGLTSAGYGVNLNTTAAESVINWFNFTAPTSTQFLANGDANISGGTYVAYLFAHNDGDGGFGENGDQDIIKCGSYTGNGTSDGSNEIVLGFEPQFVIIKNTTSSVQDWVIQDVMRGMATDGQGVYLKANTSQADLAAGYIQPTATGFKIRASSGQVNTNGNNYIYIAIRRGPMKTPESGTEVFAVAQGDNTSGNNFSFYPGFPVDMAIMTRTNATYDNRVGTRLLGATQLLTHSTAAETTNTNFVFDSNEAWRVYGFSSVFYAWNFRRAPGFFDVVAYEGTGSAGLTVNHNLGVVPELIIGKSRDSTGNGNWPVLFDMNASTHKNVYLNLTNSQFGPYTYGNGFLSSQPTSTEMVLTSTGHMNYSGDNHIAYLFATVPGVSKVGSYTGNNVAKTIDCGFSSGARFVLIKKTNAAGNWYLFDSERGIVSGNDPFLYVNETDAEYTSFDLIDPDSSGFALPSTGDLNSNNDTYIFLAIA